MPLEPFTAEERAAYLQELGVPVDRLGLVDTQERLRGGGVAPGGLNARDLVGVWSEKTFFDSLRLQGRSSVASHWEAQPNVWQLCADWCEAPVETFFFPNAVLEGREALDDETLDSVLLAPKGSRSLAMLIGREAHKEDSPGHPLFAPTWVYPILSAARNKLSATQQKRLIAAFAEGRLDLAANVAADYWLGEISNRTRAVSGWHNRGGSPIDPLARKRYQARPEGSTPASAATAWFADALSPSGYRDKSIVARQKWALPLARAWVAQDPVQAATSLADALARALKAWPLANAPKKSAPGPMTPRELDVVALAKGARKLCEEAGLSEPQAVTDILATAEFRQAKAKSAANGAAANGQELPKMDAETVKTRQTVLLTAVDGLDADAIAWCLGAGGLRGERLIFSRGTARGGLVDSLMSRENLGDEKKSARAAQVFQQLLDAGFDLLLEGKAPGGKKWGNPIERGVALVGYLDKPNALLLNAFARAQIDACVAAGMSVPDIEAWARDAAPSEEKRRYTNYDGPKSYLAALSAAIERMQINASLAEAASESAEAGSGKEGGAQSEGKRASGRRL
jgi:hypothetical protein